MEQTICDNKKCGKVLNNESDESANASVSVYDKEGNTVESKSKDFDLCPPCAKAVQSFVEGGFDKVKA